MSKELGIALSALLGVVALVFERGLLEIRLTDLESEIQLLCKLNESQEEYIDILTKHFEKEIRRIEGNDSK